ncbi:MAG: thiol oxidoreductase [Bacteroidia bacterium]|nr:thiol oxidoreductase [Bacteroidia bacterium]
MFPIRTSIVVFSAFIFISACIKLEPSAPDSNNVLDGPLAELNHEQMIQHMHGDAAFNDAIFTSENGLGPVFVANTCASCHAGDGKGHQFTSLTRFGQSDSTGNLFIGKGGPQLQNRAIPGFLPEQLPFGVPFTKLVAPAVTGLGFIDAVTDADIIAMADPTDADGDGISGVLSVAILPSYVIPRNMAIPQNGYFICRFGKKAGAYDLVLQTAKAYNQDMGIISGYEPVDPHSNLAGDPEITAQTIQDNVFYQKTLKAPLARNQNNSDVISGKQIFINIGCVTCHKKELKTGHSTISSLSEKLFFPYTDLLLHDMGSDLDDGYTEGSAKSSEWRTPALWGLGLSKNSQGGNYFLMHDGRATTIEQAVLLHGGEGSKSRSQYNALTETERKKLLIFLENL